FVSMRAPALLQCCIQFQRGIPHTVEPECGICDVTNEVISSRGCGQKVPPCSQHRRQAGAFTCHRGAQTSRAGEQHLRRLRLHKREKPTWLNVSLGQFAVLVVGKLVEHLRQREACDGCPPPPLGALDETVDEKGGE